MSQKRVFTNASWMVGEKLINIVGLLFVNSYMAKYVGPESFGKIVFASTLFTFVQTLAWFGLQNVLFKRMSSNSKSGMSLGIATYSLRIALLAVSSIFVLFYLYIYGDQITFVFGVANCIASYYIVADVFSTYNNSQLISHVNTITNMIGLGFAFITRFIFTYFSMSIFWFVIPIVLIPMVPYLLRKVYFLRHNVLQVRSRKQCRNYIRYAFKTGGALTLSTLSIVLYTQISSIFLAKLVSYNELGVYSVTMTLGGSIAIVTQALITSYFSKIYEEEDSQTVFKYLHQINLLVLGFSILTILAFFALGKAIVLLLYGEQYSKAITLIPVAILGTFFSGIGTICNRFMIKDNGYKYLSIKVFVVSLFAVVCSYVLIYNFGALGAILSFLIIEFISCTVANYFYSNKLILKVHLGTIKYTVDRILNRH